MNINLRIAVAAFASCLLVGESFAQTTDSQKFTVIVPTNITIVAPDDVVITHDESDTNQDFPAQLWSVQGNVLNGVSVSFATATPFVHATNASFKQDAVLGLALAASSGPGSWTVTQATDSTDHANTKPGATVTAASTGSTTATFDLAVSFVTGTYGDFPAGDYVTTVTGTVSAN